MDNLSRAHLNLMKSIYVAMTYQATMTLYMADSDYNFDTKEKVYDFVGKQFDITGRKVKRILQELKDVMEQPTIIALALSEPIKQYGAEIDFLARFPVQLKVEEHWKMIKDLYNKQIGIISKKC